MISRFFLLWLLSPLVCARDGVAGWLMHFVPPVDC
jgi:hypothetical protein